MVLKVKKKWCVAHLMDRFVLRSEGGVWLFGQVLIKIDPISCRP